MKIETRLDFHRCVRSSLLFFILLSLTFCSPKKESKEKQDDLGTQTRIGNTDSNRVQLQDTPSKNDSLYESILLKYPNAIKSDTIRRLFSYAFQELLGNSSNVLYFQNGRIRDIEAFKGDHIITLEVRDMQGRIIIKSDIWPKFVQYIGSKRTRARGGFVVKVLSITPVQSEGVINIDKISSSDDESISERDLSDYVHLNFETSYSPFYIIKGELIDYYFL